MGYSAQSFRLDGKVALVTGAGAGIGKAIAEMFAGAGASVVVSDRTAETAAAVAAEITAAGGRAVSIACDVTSGGGGPKPFDMPMSDFVWAFDLNIFSLFNFCQLAAPHMAKAGGGAIVNISSMAGENTASRMASYASSKAAVNHLTRNIAFDLGPRGIRVNAIAPGAIRTQALATVLTPEIEAAMLKHTPLGRLGEADDIANAALFLCAPASAWVSGQVLTVSGGGVQELD